jgi:EF-hand domain pair
VAFERHQHVELLLGVYSRQFRNVMQEASYLLSRINSKQEFLDLELALYRNRLIRMNVDLGILAVATGITTAVTGTFGMNLISGFEGTHGAFVVVSAGSALGALVVANYFRSRVSGKAIQVRAEQRIEEIQTLTRALSDMTALDFTVKKMMRGKRMSRHEFKHQLNMARNGQECSDKEIDLLFKVLDTQKDNFLDSEDFLDDDCDSDADDDFPLQPSIRDANSTKHP